MESAKLIIEVVAGLVPGTPMPEYTRRWVITGSTWEKMNSNDQQAIAEGMDEWDKVHGWSREYAARLMNPSAVNWVQLTWLWP